MNGIALHITSSDLHLASRIDRVTRFLREEGFFENVEVAGIRAGDLAAIEIQDDGRIYRRFPVRKSLREFSRLTRALDFLIWYLQILWFYLPRKLACVNAHTLAVLPPCWFLAALKGCALVYEPHELETETLSGRSFKPLLRFVEGLFIRRAYCVIAVNPPIAEWYRETYGLNRVCVVRNLPAQTSYTPLPSHYYASHFGFPEAHLVFLYQGIISDERGVDLLLSAAERIPKNNHIVFLGFGEGVEKVRQAEARLPNVHYHPAVPNNVLLSHTAAADVSLIMVKHVSLSYRYGYPNKYCESLTAHVPVICSDFMWLCGEVARYECGWSCAYDPDALAKLITGIDRAAIAAKADGAAAWARENTWANEVNVFREIYNGLQAKSRRGLASA